MNARPIPPALHVVAFLFLLAGLASVFKLVAGILNGSFSIQFGLLGIPIFFGLRSFSPGWRYWALAFLVLGVLARIFLAVVALSAPGPVPFKVYGIPLGSLTPPGLLLYALAGLLFYLWQLHVLMRQNVRVLFHGEDSLGLAVKS